MRCAVISDTHWCIKRSNKVFEEHIASFHERLVDYCTKNSIKHILHLGDFFDTRGNINVLTLQTIKTRFLDKLAENGIQLIMVPGNHDLPYRNSIEASAITLVFNEYKNVTVYETPTIHTFEDKTNVLMVPWIAKDQEREFISKIDSFVGYTDICLGHFEFSGFLYAKGVIAEEGMDSSIFTPKFDLILSGHYHSKSSKGNIHYLGTQYQLTWADFDEKKYFHILDTSTKELIPVENPVQMFHKIFYDESIIDETDLSDLNDSAYTNSIIKIVVLNRKNMVKFELFMDAVFANNPYHVEVIDESVVASQKEIKVDSSVLMKGTMEIINEIIDEMKETDYNMPLVKKLMNDFYHESTI